MEKAKKLIFISCVITLIISTINVLDTELLTSTIDFIITITVFLTAISKQINLLKYNKLNFKYNNDNLRIRADYH